MKKVINWCLLGLGALFAAGAIGHATMSPEERMRSDAMSAAREAVRVTLRDPWSASIDGLTVYKNGNVCGIVNAKNGFGAYTGYHRFAWKNGSLVAVIDGPSVGQRLVFDKAQKEICAG